MSYAKYDSYKDSGVDWLGEIPSDWDLVPLRAIFRFRNEKNNPIITENILSLSIAKGVTSYDENRGGNKRKDDITAYKIARPNDIVLNSMNVIVGAVGVSKYFGAISPVYYALYAFNDLGYVPYFNWIFQNTGFQKGLLKYGKGILIKLGEEGKMNTIRMKISQDDLKVLQFPLPNFEKQTKIANFLDQKTAQIDQAIALKQQQIEKLNEYKQIVIQNAVTKGLNPNAPMKDSGVAWIGDIPEHWEVKKLKFLGKCIIGLTYSPNDISDKENGTLVLRSSNLKNGHFYYSEDANVYVKTEIPNKLFLKKDDILICSRNGSRDLIGKCAIATEKDIGSSFGAFTTVFRSELNSYLYFIFNSSIFKLLAGSFLTSTINQLTTGNLNTMQMPIPPNRERQEIISYLTNFNEKIANTIRNYQTQIDRLKEYKNILINQAVTGKIKI